ncbi:unnamed protein product [Prunus armeniaca]|uniref:DNA topoisomerase n=1 Tax=Prunus armeniaca TaxID=36596 RepID=A0A6J5VXA0_PRUAR|nr:unnamed protein product [Prunus armeniaca]
MHVADSVDVNRANSHVASSALGFGPQMAMQVAERLYTQGFIRFHSLSDIYKFQENSLSSTVMKPELEDISNYPTWGTLGAQVNNPTWGSYVQRLLADGYQKPRSGTDVGDHPPVTPLRSATEDMLGNDAWRLYEYICTHFIGTVSPDCKYVR